MIYKEKAVWKTYPEFPFIEVSQFGDVRTKDRYVKCKDGKKRLIKSRELKQDDNGHGYKYVHVCVNGKTVHIYVHRLVATCFVPNPFGLPEINHLDNNPANNIFSNLQWCTHQENMTYKEKFGTSALEVSGRPVFAVNLETGKVFYFESQSEAARKLGVDNSLINEVVKGRKPTAGGCWLTEDKSEITGEKIQKIKNSMLFLGGVIAINLDTFEVLRFESQREAERKLSISNQYINDVVKGRANKAKNYWFCYADNNAVEKTREKFGNEVANKVKNLMKRIR